MVAATKEVVDSTMPHDMRLWALLGVSTDFAAGVSLEPSRSVVRVEVEAGAPSASLASASVADTSVADASAVGDAMAGGVSPDDTPLGDAPDSVLAEFSLSGLSGGAGLASSSTACIWVA